MGRCHIRSAGLLLAVFGSAGASPVLQTLVATPFGATGPAEVRDSVSIDLALP